MKRTRIFYPLFMVCFFWGPGALQAFCPPGAIEVEQGCEGFTLQGCCAADIVMWCETATDTVCMEICTTNTDGNTTCGWKNFSYECQPVQTADPTGQHPLVCGDTPSNDCADIGPKGCCTQNDSVKYCTDGQVETVACAANSSPQSKKCGWNSTLNFYDCTGANIEEPTGSHPFYCPGEDPSPGCEPACGNKQCGDDGCGGSCGTCSGSYVCSNGYCVPPTCTPQCAGKACGDDGCGGSCGSCPAGFSCDAQGQCFDGNCTPDCTGKQCGSDGCGGTCGDCPWGMSCSEQQLCSGTCMPDCVQFGKQCGDDGCGGSCGTCGPGTECNAQFQCGACADTCNGKQCGDNGCGGVCGVCGTGEVCSAFGFCILANCTPYCVGKQCGDDGCGGQCGVCLNGGVCSQGLCVGGSPATDTTNSSDVQCLPGQVLQYGACVYPAPGPVPTNSSSGCQHSRAPQGLPWALVFVVLGLVTLRKGRERDWS